MTDRREPEVRPDPRPGGHRNLRVAVAGTGAMAARHLAALGRAGGTTVAGHLSRDLARANAAAEQWGGHGYDDIDKMLYTEAPDALWICVPPDAHGELEMAALRRGVPLFIEKPLAAGIADAERIAAAVAEAAIPVAVGYHFRAFGHVRAARAELAGRTVELVRGAWHGETPAPLWWRDRARSGGQMVEQATHVVDLARHLVGEATVECAAAVRGDGDPADGGSDVSRVTAAILRFAGGAVGAFSATRILDAAADVGLELYCDGLKVVIDRRQATFTTGSGTRTIIAQDDAFVAENQAFLTAVRTGDPGAVLCGYDDALRTHRLCCQMQQRAEDPS